ncbi:hypothetical protein E1H99_08860, partial [Enterococcus hirae]
MIKVKNSYVERLSCLLCILTFSFYLMPDIKIQFYQIILYPLSFYLIIKAILSNVLIDTRKLIYYYFYFIVFMYIFIITVIHGNTINVIPGIKNWIDPILVIIIFNIVLDKNNEENFYQTLIFKIAKIVVFLLSLNTLWSITTMFYDTTFINGFFWGAELASGSKATGMGRYSGVFIQPIEAGVVYSIGLLLFWYLLKKNNKLSLQNFVPFILIISGGLLSVSKVFIFCGLPLFVILILFFLNSKKIIKIMFFVVGAFLILSYIMSIYWNGYDYLLRFFDLKNNNSIIELLTAGRFNGRDSQQFNLIKNFSWSEMIFGRGFGADETYDSIIFYFLSVGGIIVLSLGFCYIMWLLLKAIKKIDFNKDLDVFFLFFTVLIVISSLG